MEYPKIENIKIETTGWLGDAVIITVILNVNTVTSALITIDDPTEAVLVNAANMVRETDKVYYYSYQSDADEDEGDYVITFKITYAGKTLIQQKKFTLVEQD